VKKISIQIKIGLLLLVAVILLIATSFLSYRNLSSIVSSIQIELTPELRLESIHNISRDLENADNSIRVYSFTRDTIDLRPYYAIINGIDDKVNKLKQQCSKDTIMLCQLDTISNLIEENIVIWNELLYFIDSDNAAEFMNQLSEKIKGEVESNEKKGILKRVFSRNSKSMLSDPELVNKLKKVEEQGKLTKEKLKTGESQLAWTSSSIKERFFELITRMGTQVSQLVLEKGKAANQLAKSTYTWLVLFSVSGGLLVLLILYIIIRYVRHAHSYQIALEKSKSEAEDLARAKELFMANISHEIRTPVTAISGFIEQLLHETMDENDLRSLKIVKSSSDHLAKIIDDILDLSKLQNGKLTLEKVHFRVAPILEEVSLIFEQNARQNNTRLEYKIKSGTPPVLLGDPYRLKQILINLVGNSVKFTEHGIVEFSFEGKANNSGELDLVIEVADTGIGIDEDKLSIIFDDFTQAEMNTTRKYGGTGLGLSIVKKLVELHSGTINCKSKKGAGTKMTCHLPYRTGIDTEIRKDNSSPLYIPDDVRNLKVLIVDDEEYNRLLFRKILERWKVNCDDVASGGDAIEKLRGKKYDLVFMDIRMPGMDGLEATLFIREELKISENEMQVICISAVPLSEGREESRKAGMNEFLQKPFTEEMLLMSILTARGISQQPISENKIDFEKDKSAINNKINLSNLSHISGGDNQFIRQMLVSFNDTTNKGLKEMQNSITSGQWNSVANLAHKMLPPCRHIGATELCNLLVKIEESIEKKSDKQHIETLTNKFVSEFDVISKLLDDYIAQLN
jgi:signal transduction histidine kinase/FixJ family two-component response regulator/CHASE3 domain sensor protein